jgi:hypothetical protein
MEKEKQSVEEYERQGMEKYSYKFQEETLEETPNNEEQMCNNKQQTAVEMMWDEIDNLFSFKDSVEAQKFCAILDKYKEIHKKQMCKFAYKCHNHYKVYGDFNIEHFYNETYGGNK